MPNGVRCYAAPLEGVTGFDYRAVHAALFEGVDQYFTPFLSPITDGGLTPRAMREVLPENNRGIRTIPQLLTNDAAAFIAASEVLAEMGYEEVNLNLGCPSGTVVSKGKASGMLNDPDAVDSLLDGIFARCAIKVSVKTRIGRFDAEEIVPLMEVYNRYPIAELTVHPRIRGQMYRGKPNIEAFGYVMETARMPVCYNGDLFRKEDAQAVLARFPTLSRLMFGRGLIANPGLIGEVKGGARAGKEALLAYHDGIFTRTTARLSGDKHLLHHMKEIWSYLIFAFDGGERYAKAIKKSTCVEDYLAAVKAMFASCPLSETGAYRPPNGGE